LTDRSGCTGAAFQALRFVSALLVLGLAVYGLVRLLVDRNNGLTLPTVIRTSALSPVSRGEILSEFKVITVERQYRIPVMGSSFKPMPTAARNGTIGAIATALFGNRESLPGTKRQMVYDMVTTVTAGIDLGKLAPDDIANSDTETTVTLPAPEVLSVIYDGTQSQMFSQDNPSLPYMGDSASLLAEMQKTGLEKHRMEAEADEALMAKARENARKSLQRFLEKTHPGRTVHVVFEKKGAAAAAQSSANTTPTAPREQADKLPRVQPR
jgi:hypothetical protein